MPLWSSEGRLAMLRLKALGLVLALLGATLTIGCADKSEKIEATYVSPLKYKSYTCQQLEQEYARVAQQSSMINKKQDDIAENDETAMAIVLILVWPSLFFIEGYDKKEEVGRLKGNVNAIEQSSIQKNCMTLAKTIRDERAAAALARMKKEAKKDGKEKEYP